MKTRCPCGAPLDSDSIDGRCTDCLDTNPELLDEPIERELDEYLYDEDFFPDLVDHEE